MIGLHEQQQYYLSAMNCLSCNKNIEGKCFETNYFPILDSTGSGIGRLECPYCGEPNDVFLRRSRNGWDVEQVQIVGFPGPDYISIVRFELDQSVRPAWEINSEPFLKLVKERNWDVYAFNWLTSGIIRIFIDLKRLATYKKTIHPKTYVDPYLEIDDIKQQLEIFKRTGYAKILSDLGIGSVPSILFEGNSSAWNDLNQIPIVWPAFQAKAAQVYEIAHKAYAEEYIDESWLRTRLPELISALSSIATQLPNK